MRSHSCPGCGAPAAARCDYCGRGDERPARIFAISADATREEIDAITSGKDGAVIRSRPGLWWDAVDCLDACGMAAAAFFWFKAITL
jgi:hypothetical protein